MKPKRVLPVLLLYFVIWVLADHFIGIEDFIVPPPMTIVRTLIIESPTIIRHSITTLQEALSGLLIGTGIGMLFALMFLFWSPFDYLITPGAVIIKSLPFVAVVPILIITLGGGMAPKVIVTILVCFFPVMVSFYKGLYSAERELVDLFHLMNASRWQTLLKLRLPYSLPFLFRGIEIAASSAVVVAIVGEIFGSDKGLGFLIIIAKYEYHIERLYAAMIYSSLLTLTFVAGARFFESIFIRWEETSV